MNTSFQSGLSAYRQNRYSDAAAYFKNAADTEPQNVNYLYYYAESLVQTGKPDDASEILTQALAVFDAEALRYRRGELSMEKAPQNALADFTRIIETDTAEEYWKALAHLSRGLICLEKGEIDMAIADFDAAKELAEKINDRTLLARISDAIEKNGF